MDNDEIIIKANNIVSDYINRTKIRNKYTLFGKTTLFRYLLILSIIFAFVLSILYFYLWINAS